MSHIYTLASVASPFGKGCLDEELAGFDRQNNRQSDRPTDRQTDRQTDVDRPFWVLFPLVAR